MSPLLLVVLLLEQKSTVPFRTLLSVAEMTNKQAVVDTTAGTFVIDLRPDLAPNHVGHFIKLARSGAYRKTTFHRVVRHGIIQGGDPLTRDPANKKLYGTGGLGLLEETIPRARPRHFSSLPAWRARSTANTRPSATSSTGSRCSRRSRRLPWTEKRR